MMIKIGQYDNPRNQSQPIFELNPYEYNIAIFGGPQTGKTTLLKTILVRLHEDIDLLPVDDVYIIDFNSSLKDYGKLCNVCACFDSSNEENIRRIFKTVEKRLDENSLALNGQNYYDVLKSDPSSAPPHMFLIIDNLNAFLEDERYSSYQDELMAFSRNGLAKGLTTVITANDLAGTGRLLNNFGQKISFELLTDSYFEIFNAKVNKPLPIKGRGLANLGSDIFEFQCLLPFTDFNETEGLNALLEETQSHTNSNKLIALPNILDKNNICSFTNNKRALSKNEVEIGLDYYDHTQVTVDLQQYNSIAIYGKRQFGKTNLLKILLNGIKGYWPNARFVFLDDGRQQLIDFFKGEFGNSSVYITKLKEYTDYLKGNGYYPISDETDNPPTVFVLQAKWLFNSSGDILRKSFPAMFAEAETHNYIFIFSDVPNISNKEIQVTFNDNISLAFVLDNIDTFIADKNGKTALGEMDSRDLKVQFARCTVGDGYIYDTQGDLRKIKILKY